MFLISCGISRLLDRRVPTIFSLIGSERSDLARRTDVNHEVDYNVSICAMYIFCQFFYVVLAKCGRLVLFEPFPIYGIASTM